MEPTAQHLYDRGRRDLESRFDPEPKLVRSPFLPDKHMPHPSLWYAHCLLADGDEASVSLAHEIIERVLEMQETRDGDPHHGNFRWYWQDGGVIDLNAAQFVLEALVHLLPRVGDRLRPDLRERVLAAMRLAMEEAERLDVHWTYTNIYLLDVQGSILGGQVLEDGTITSRGETRLRDWASRTSAIGAPHEFNSPTYAAVQIQALAMIAQQADNPSTRTLALEMEHVIWRHVARYWHAPTMQLGGPHSRAYRRDVVGASGFLKTVLFKLLGDERLLATTPYYMGPDSEGEVMVALTSHHCPEDAEQMFRVPATRSFSQPVSETPPIETTTYVTPEFSLGTMSRPYGVGDPPEPWPAQNSCICFFTQAAPPGYGVLYARYRVNAGPMEDGVRPAAHWLDIWDDGLFRAVQRDGRAIVAYGLMPRGQRPVDSLRLDLRLMSADTRCLLAKSPTLVFETDSVMIGIVPLRASMLSDSPMIETWRDGPELVVSIINYEGSPKQFWEYRSLSGPFFKGNIRNGFCLRIAARSEFASAEDFLAELVANPPTDDLSGTWRRVTWGRGDDALTLEYDLRTMWP